MPAVYAPASPPANEAASLSERSAAERLSRLDAALRDMAETCPLPNGLQALAERLDQMADRPTSRRRPRAIRRTGVA